MPYTVQEFLADESAMPEINSAEWDLPESEWPRFHLTDTNETLAIPMNNPMSRRTQHFFEKYGRKRGADNALRFELVTTFLADHGERLVQEGLAIYGPDGKSFAIHAGFLEFLLNGFQEPVPPVIFPKHIDANKVGELPYRKIIRRWHHTRKQDSSESQDH